MNDNPSLIHSPVYEPDPPYRLQSAFFSFHTFIYLLFFFKLTDKKQQTLHFSV